jgi:hypothetical protein
MVTDKPFYALAQARVHQLVTDILDLISHRTNR